MIARGQGRNRGKCKNRGVKNSQWYGIRKENNEKALPSFYMRKTFREM